MREPREQLSGPERQRILLETARSDGKVRVVEAAERLGVTPETVRKDLSALQASGVIRRVHGGGVPVESLSYEPQLTARTDLLEEKRRIARAALAELPSNGVVFIESGTTTQLLAEAIPPDRALVVVTNSLPAAMQLSARPRLTVVALGGRVRPVTLGTVGGQTVRQLTEINADVAFLGTNALDVAHGLTTPDLDESDTKRAALRSARRRVLLADRTKIGRVASFRYGEVSDIDLLITDDGAGRTELSRLAGEIGEIRRV